MTVLRMDNVGIVVNDMDGAVDFFVELGSRSKGEAPSRGHGWTARSRCAMPGARSRCCGCPTATVPLSSAGSSRRRLPTPEPTNAPVNTLGYLRVMFAVDDIRDVVARLERLGASVVDEIVNYEDVYLLCYVRAARASSSGSPRSSQCRRGDDPQLADHARVARPDGKR
jgi:catechol 2,3-dioxygenase-like lactoylglutathione lyase family enzyme